MKLIKKIAKMFSRKAPRSGYCGSGYSGNAR
jgi:hypothetical protein